MDNQNDIGLFEKVKQWIERILERRYDRLIQRDFDNKKEFTHPEPEQREKASEKTDAHRLYQAAAKGDLKAVQKLVEQGVTPDMEYRHMVMGLVESEIFADEGYADFFIQELGERCGWGEYDDIIEIAIHHRMDFLPERINRYSIVAALNNDHIEVAKYLAEQGFAKDAFVLAVQNDAAIAEKLISLDVAEVAQNSRALWNAAKEQNWNMVKYLVEHGGNLEDGLRAAIDGGSLSTIQHFMELGANPNEYALNRSVEKRNISIVTYLVEHKAPMSESLVDRALSNDAPEMVRYLIEQGASLTCKTLSSAERSYNRDPSGRELICFIMDALQKKDIQEHGVLQPETAHVLDSCRESLLKQVSYEKNELMEELLDKVDETKKEIGQLDQEVIRLTVEPSPTRLQDRLPDTQAQTREQPKDPPRHSADEIEKKSAALQLAVRIETFLSNHDPAYGYSAEPGWENKEQAIQSVTQILLTQDTSEFPWLQNLRDEVGAADPQSVKTLDQLIGDVDQYFKTFRKETVLHDKPTPTQTLKDKLADARQRCEQQRADAPPKQKERNEEMQR